MKKKSIIVCISFIMILLFALTVTSSADSSSFAGGTGTSEDPYQVETKRQLAAVSEYREASFVLTKDIIFEDADFQSGGEFYNSGNLWRSICSPNSFQGTFDGNGYKISNLHLSSNSGLFYNIDSRSTIKNLILENVKKINGSYGTLCISNYGTIENCAVSGTVYGNSGMIGGLVGVNESTGIISNCYNISMIFGNQTVTGGIAAQNEGTIINSYNAGNVTLKRQDVVYGCAVGGIAGNSSGTIENCYNAGFLNKSYGILPGGIVGNMTSSAVLTNSYTASNFESNEIGAKLEVEEMKNSSAFEGFDFDNTWTIDTDSEYPFPHLKSSGLPMMAFYSEISEGTGTNYDPYVVSNAADLNAVRDNLGACYIMDADIDLSLYEDWVPVGICVNSTPAEDHPFVGRFIGGGHKVTGIKSSKGGLFGGNEGLISGVVIENACISPQNTDEPFGAVVGTNEGVIEYCVNKSDLYIESDTAGGIVGCNYSAVNKCANHGTVSASLSSDVTGGIAGENRGYITESYNCGKVAGYETGGIAGGTYTENGIENVFNIGNVTGINHAGGIAGDVSSNDVVVNNAYNAGIVSGSYRGAIVPRPESDTKAIGENVYSVEYHSNDSGVAALDLIPFDEMDDQSSFSGFDFDSVWEMGEADYVFPCIQGTEIPVWGLPNDKFDGGTGTLADPYLVSDITQLKAIQEDTSNHFKLSNDIDLGDEFWNPISDMYFGVAAGFFGGVLDGNNKIISNMKCASDVYSNGFVAANSGVIKNLNIHDARVSGSNSCVGIIAGQNFRGQISNCGVYGELELMTNENDITNTKAGGIAGTNSGTIDSSFFSGTISIARETYAKSYAGGIVGSGGGSISNCYSHLSAYGPQNAYKLGGIAGVGGSIDNTYAICNFDGLTDTSWDPYGIASSATVTDSYYTDGLDITGATKLFLAEMQDKSSFAGFDFENIWVIDDGDIPRLRAVPVLAEGLKLNIPACEYVVGSVIDDISVIFIPAYAMAEEVKITSSNNNVLQPNEDGTFTAVDTGKAEIVATSGKFSDSKEVTVYPAIEGIRTLFDGQERVEAFVYEGSTHTLQGVVYPEGAKAELTYFSDNEEVVSVTDDGKVSAISCGTADLTVSDPMSAVKGVLTVHVIKHIPDTVKAKNMELLVGQTQILEYECSPSEGIVLPQFVSSAPKVVSVTEDGEIIALSAGTAVISITFDNGIESVSCEFEVTVKCDISQETMILEYDSVRYDGTVHCPEVKIEGFEEDIDYSVEYSDNLYPGTAAVNVIGIGQCCGQLSGTFDISRPVVAAQKKVSINLKPTNGYKSIKATWSTQKVAGAKVKYIVQYKKYGGKWYYASKGTALSSLSVKGLTAGKKYFFKVTPYVVVNGVTYKGASKISAGVYTLKVPTYVKVSKSSKNYIKVKWTGMQGESGYQIQRSKYAKTGFITLKKVSSKYSSTKIKTPKNKKYYYRVRAYKKVGERIVYGPWSTVKSFKLK